MKSKNIPADIGKKSIKEAQLEIKEIIEKLEDEKVNLEHMKDQYDRMMLLNYHIQNQFKQKADLIRKNVVFNNKKKSK